MSGKLYYDLMKLCSENEAFFFKDFERDNQRFRIFNYRLASYTDFMQPSALECRGVMFEIDERDLNIRIASRTMEKFFNLNENPMTMDLDLSDIKNIMTKEDGSLISSYMYGDNIGLKSKGSLSSEQAIAAEEFLKGDELFLRKVIGCELSGFTVNFEWCSPDNRIVLGYQYPQLKVINARNRRTGEYMNFSLLEDIFRHHMCNFYKYWAFAETPEQFIEMIPDMKDIEGFVIQLHSGQFIKIKTEWYLALHHSKDSINSPRRLFEAILEEATDDLKSMFYDDKLLIKTIEEMESKVEYIYNHLVDGVEKFYDVNKGLERKDYAILGQQQFVIKPEFGLAMNLYLGKENDYKAFLKKHYKTYGIEDEVSED